MSVRSSAKPLHKQTLELDDTLRDDALRDDALRAEATKAPGFVKVWQKHKIPIIVAIAVVVALSLGLGLGLKKSPTSTVAPPAKAPPSTDSGTIVYPKDVDLFQKLTQAEKDVIYTLSSDVKLAGAECKDDPNNLLSGVGISCAQLKDLCDADVSSMSPMAPKGTYLNQICVETCNNCGNFTMFYWPQTFDCFTDADCRKADPQAQCLEPGIIGKCVCSKYFSGQYCQYEPTETVVDDLTKATGPTSLDPNLEILNQVPVCPELYCPTGYEMIGFDQGSTPKNILGRMFSGFPTRRPAHTDPTDATFQPLVAPSAEEDPAVLKLKLMDVTIRYKGIIPLNASVLFFYPDATQPHQVQVAIRVFVPPSIDILDLARDQFKSFLADNQKFDFKSPGANGEGISLVVSSANFHRFGYSIVKGLNARMQFQPASDYWKDLGNIFTPRPRYPMVSLDAPFSAIIRGYYPLDGGADAWGATLPSVDVLVPMVRLNIQNYSFMGQPGSTILRAGKAQMRLDVNVSAADADPYVFSELYFQFPHDSNAYIHSYATLSLSNQKKDISVTGGIYSYKLHGLEKWLGIKKIALKAKTDGFAMPIAIKQIGLSIEAELKFGGVSNQPVKVDAIYVPQSEGEALYGFQLKTGQMKINDIGAMVCSFIKNGCTPQHQAYITDQLGKSVDFEAAMTIANGDVVLPDGTFLQEGVNFDSSFAFETPAAMQRILATFNSTGSLSGARSYFKFGCYVPLSVQRVEQALREEGSVDLNMKISYDVMFPNEAPATMPFELELLSVQVHYRPGTAKPTIYLNTVTLIKMQTIETPLTLVWKAGYDGDQSMLFLNISQIGEWQVFPFLALRDLKGTGSWMMGSSLLPQARVVNGFNFSTSVILGFSQPIYIKGHIDPSKASVEMEAKADNIQANMGDLFRMYKQLSKSSASLPANIMSVVNDVTLTGLDFRMSPTSVVSVPGVDNLPKGLYVAANATLWGAQCQVIAEAKTVTFNPPVNGLTSGVDVVVSKLSLTNLRPSMVPYLQPATAILGLLGKAFEAAAKLCPTCSLSFCVKSICKTATFGTIGEDLKQGLDGVATLDSLEIDPFSVRNFMNGGEDITLRMAVSIFGSQLKGSLKVPISLLKNPMGEAGKYVGQLADSMFKESTAVSDFASSIMANLTIRVNNDDQNPLNIVFTADKAESDTTLAARQKGVWKPVEFLSMKDATVEVTLDGTAVKRAWLSGQIDLGLNASVSFKGGYFKTTGEMGFVFNVKGPIPFSAVGRMAEKFSGNVFSPTINTVMDNVFLDDISFEFSPGGCSTPEMTIAKGFRFTTNLTIFGASLDIAAVMKDKNVSHAIIKDFEFELMLSNLKPSLVPLLKPYDAMMRDFGAKIAGFAKMCPACALRGCLGNSCKTVTLSEITTFVQGGLDNVFTLNRLGVEPFSLYNLQHGGALDLVLDAVVMGIPVKGSVPLPLSVFKNLASSMPSLPGLNGGVPTSLPSVPDTSDLASTVKNLGMSVFGKEAAAISNAVFRQFSGNVSLMLGQGFEDDDFNIAFEGEFKETLEFTMSAHQVGVWRPYDYLKLEGISASVAVSKADGIKGAQFGGTLTIAGNPVHFSGGMNAQGVFSVNVSFAGEASALDLKLLASHFTNVMNNVLPANCAQIAKETPFAVPANGFYTIQADPNVKAYGKVYCDFSELTTSKMVWTMCGKYDRDNAAKAKFLTRDFGRDAQNVGDLRTFTRFTASQASIDCRPLAQSSSHIMAVGHDTFPDGKLTTPWAKKVVLPSSGYGFNENMWNINMDSTFDAKECVSQKSTDGAGTTVNTGYYTQGAGTGWTNKNRNGNVFSDAGNAFCNGTTGTDAVLFGWIDNQGKNPDYDCTQNHVGTYCSNVDATAPAHRYNMIFFGSAVGNQDLMTQALRELKVSSVELYAEMGGAAGKAMELKARMALWGSTIKVDGALREKTVGGGAVGAGACSTGYSGVKSGVEVARHTCEQRCIATAGCVYYAFCDAVNMEACAGAHLNKCAIYIASTCTLTKGAASEFTGYTTYKIGSEKIIDVDLLELSLNDLQSQYITPLRATTDTALAAVVKKLATVSHACPKCVFSGCLAQNAVCLQGTADELATQIKTHMNNFLVINKLWLSPISLYEVQKNTPLVLNLDAVLFGVAIKGSIAAPDFLMTKINDALSNFIGPLGSKAVKKSDDAVATLVYNNFASIGLRMTAEADPLQIQFDGAFQSTGHFSVSAKQVALWKPLGHIDPNIGLSVNGLTATVDFSLEGLETATLSGFLNVYGSKLGLKGYYNGYTSENYAHIALSSGVSLKDVSNIVKGVNNMTGMTVSLPDLPSSELVLLTDFDLKISTTGIPSATCGDLALTSTNGVCNMINVGGKCETSLTYDAAKRFCGAAGARLCSISELRNLPAPPQTSDYECLGAITGNAATRLTSGGGVQCLGTGSTCAAICTIAGTYTQGSYTDVTCGSNSACFKTLELKSRACTPIASASYATSWREWQPFHDFTVSLNSVGTVSMVLSPQASNQGDVYEIRHTKTRTEIRSSFGGNVVAAYNHPVALQTVRFLWVTLKHERTQTVVSVGTGTTAGQSQLVQFVDKVHVGLPVKYLSIGVIGAADTVVFEQLCNTVAVTPVQVCSVQTKFWSSNTAGCQANEYSVLSAVPGAAASCSHETKFAGAMCCTSSARTFPRGLEFYARANIWGVTAISIRGSMSTIMPVPAGIPHDLSIDEILMKGSDLSQLPPIQNAAAVLDEAEAWVRSKLRLCLPTSVCNIVPASYDAQCRDMLCTDILASVAGEVISWVRSAMLSIMASVVNLHELRIKQFSVGQIMQNVGKLGFYLSMTVIGIPLSGNGNLYVSDLTTIAKGGSVVNVLANRLMTEAKAALASAWTSVKQLCEYIKNNACVTIDLSFFSVFGLGKEKICMPMPC